MVPTSTRYPTYPAAEKPDHTRQHLPCHSTEVRDQHTKMRLPPAPPRRKRRQWARSSRQHALRPDVPDTPPRRKHLTPHHHAQTVVHYTPNTPCHPHSTEVNCTLSNHAGGFATIDHRHAGDTPQRSAYGSNSPQATNENKPHHPDKQTKTCRTRPTQPPKEHAALALPSNHGGFATIDPRHADDTPQSSAYGSNSPQATNENKPHHPDKQTKTCRTRPTQPPKEHAALALPSNHGGFATIDPRHADDTPQGSAYGSNSPHRAQASTGAARSNRKPPQHTQHIRHTQHTRRGAAASAVAPLPGSQPETRVT